VSWGRQTLTLHGEVKAANAASASTVGRYSLGGFQQLSGYQPGQVSGNAMVYGRLNWYMRLAETPSSPGDSSWAPASRPATPGWITTTCD
jgi:NTE family protein